VVGRQGLDKTGGWTMMRDHIDEGTCVYWDTMYFDEKALLN